MARDIRRGRRPVEVDLDTRKMARCREVLGDDMILAHVHPSGSDQERGTRYVVIGPDGIVANFYRSDLNGAEMFDFVVDLIAGMLCEECGEQLLDGEERVCGPCEAKQIMELVRIRDDLRR